MFANFSIIGGTRGTRAVAFDLDDTLFDRQAALGRLLERWLGAAEAAIAMPEVLARDDGGRSSRRVFFEWLASRFPRIGLDAEGVAKRFRREFPGCVAVDPEAVHLLSGLRAAGVPLALLSNGSTSFQLEKLRASGTAGFFRKSHILISGSLGVSKPDPRAFASLAERLGVPPAGILFVGNDPVNDTGGARACGMPTCLMARSSRSPAVDVADLRVSSFQQLAEELLVTR